MASMPLDEAALFGELVDLLSEGPGRLSESILAGIAGMSQRMALLEDNKRAVYGQLFRLVEDLQALLQHRESALAQLHRARQEALYRLAMVPESKRGGLPQEVLRIGVISALLAHWLGYDSDFCDNMELAAPLLDVGEIDGPAPMTHQTCCVSPWESSMFREHCRAGYQLLAGSGVPELDLAAEIALAHHERFDGRGYPYGLVGEHIPPAARIVAVVDGLEFLCRAMPGRSAMSPQAALAQVEADAPACYDPAVVHALVTHQSIWLAVRENLGEELEAPEFFSRWHHNRCVPGYWRRFCDSGAADAAGAEIVATRVASRGSGVSGSDAGWPGEPG